MRTSAGRSRADDLKRSPAPNRFAASTALARKGRYSEASRLLQAALEAGECQEADALDLQARMLAQQGLYLHAESCWQKAKRLDGSNPAYDDALALLRRGRLPSNRLFRSITWAGLLAFLGVVLWQAALVRQAINNALVRNEGALVEIRRDVARLDEASRAMRQELTTSSTDLVSYRRDFDARISHELDRLSKAAGTAKEREALVTFLNERFSVIENSIIRQIQELFAVRSERDALQTGAIEAIQTSLQRLEGGASAFKERAEERDARMRRDVQFLSTPTQIASIRQEIAKLQEQLTKLTAVLDASLRAPAPDDETPPP